MSRTDARECGFKMIFESFFSNQIDVEKFLHETIVDDEQPLTPIAADDCDKQCAPGPLTIEEESFAKAIFKAYEDNKENLENKFSDNLKKGLKVNDIYKLDRAIIFAAMAQIDFLGESVGLAINEAVRMAKKYSTEQSPRFVNGVLASIYGK